MQIHQLKPKTKWKSKKRVGRGGIKGTYSGRGLKGQNSRAGHKLPPIVRSIIKRYPKLRGYDFRANFNKPIAVNLAIIEKKFDDGAIINPQTLIEKKVIRTFLGDTPVVKILAKGDIKKKFDVQNCFVSKSAKIKIEKAGGKVVPLINDKKVNADARKVRKKMKIANSKIQKAKKEAQQSAILKTPKAKETQKPATAKTQKADKTQKIKTKHDK